MNGNTPVGRWGLEKDLIVQFQPSGHNVFSRRGPVLEFPVKLSSHTVERYERTLKRTARADHQSIWRGIHIIVDLDPNGCEGLSMVRRALTDADEVRDIVFFKDGDVCRQGLVGGTVEDEEAERAHLDGADAEACHGCYVDAMMML